MNNRARLESMLAVGALVTCLCCACGEDVDLSAGARPAEVLGASTATCGPLRFPWDDAGITAAWHTQDGQTLTIVSRDRMWNMRWSDEVWTFAGQVKDVVPFTTAPLVNGRYPWEGPGITAAWHTQDGSILTIVSQDLWWNLQWAGDVWLSQGFLKDLPPFPQAPAITGQRPWEGAGVTAAWHTQDGSLLTIVSENRLWNMRWSDLAWITAQPLSTVPPMSTAPLCCNEVRPGTTGIFIDNLTIWDGAGITAAWHTPDNSILTLVNESRLWNLSWATTSFLSPTPLFLDNVPPFPSAPGVAR